MSEIFKKSASALVLAAAAAGFTGAANAGENCDSIARAQGVSEFPAVGAAFTRSGSTGCKFIIDGDGKHALAQTYDFAARGQEQMYSRELQSAARMQQNADRRAEQQAERNARMNDPVRNIGRQVNEAAGAVNAIKNLGNVLKGFGR